MARPLGSTCPRDAPPGSNKPWTDKPNVLIICPREGRVSSKENKFSRSAPESCFQTPSALVNAVKNPLSLTDGRSGALCLPVHASTSLPGSIREIEDSPLPPRGPMTNCLICNKIKGDSALDLEFSDLFPGPACLISFPGSGSHHTLHARVS